MSPGGSQVNPSPPLLSEVLCTMWTHSVTGDREAAPLTPRTPPPPIKCRSPGLRNLGVGPDCGRGWVGGLRGVEMKRG